MNGVKEARKRKGLRQIDLAEALGISVTWVWVIENSRGRGVSAEIKKRVAKVLNCSAQKLFPNN